MSIWDSSIPVEKSSYILENKFSILKQPSINLTMKYSMIDMFSGAGGFAVAGKWAGFQSVIGIDYLRPAMETWSINHPNGISILGDIRYIKPEFINELISEMEIDLITAGIPCQGFSLANRKHNTEDVRNYLFLEVINYLKILNPRAVIIENVSALRSRGDGKFEKAIVEYLEEIGYKTSVKTLNALNYGVPQSRQRVFFVGIKAGQKFLFPDKRFISPEKINENNKEKFKPIRTVFDAIYDLPKIKSHESSNEYLTGIELTEYQNLMRGIGNGLVENENLILYNHVAPKHDIKTIERIKNTKPGESMYDKYKQRIRLSYEKPSPTQVAGGIRPQFQFGHPEVNRGLTIRERARIQSFPDDFIFQGSVVQERVQTGNAVPPLLAYYIMNELITYL